MTDVMPVPLSKLRGGNLDEIHVNPVPARTCQALAAYGWMHECKAKESAYVVPVCAATWMEDWRNVLWSSTMCVRPVCVQAAGIKYVLPRQFDSPFFVMAVGVMERLCTLASFWGLTFLKCCNAWAS